MKKFIYIMLLALIAGCAQPMSQSGKQSAKGYLEGLGYTDIEFLGYESRVGHPGNSCNGSQRFKCKSPAGTVAHGVVCEGFTGNISVIWTNDED